jgi:AcrR family transcriptional regulator
MSPRPRKNEQQASLPEAIKNTAWKQIARYGASALNLRAISRELDITAPAIYNYFPNRDALVTALITEAFTALGESQRQATGSGLDLADQLSSLGLAYRKWAVAYPQRYQLIFGTPISGYHAPEDVTIPAMAWSLVPLIESLQAIFKAGKLKIEQLAPLTSALKRMLEAWREFAGGPDVEVLYAALVIWSRVHGLVSIEIGNQMPSFITDPGEIFRREIKAILCQYIK